MTQNIVQKMNNKMPRISNVIGLSSFFNGADPGQRFTASDGRAYLTATGFFLRYRKLNSFLGGLGVGEIFQFVENIAKYSAMIGQRPRLKLPYAFEIYLETELSLMNLSPNASRGMTATTQRSTIPNQALAIRNPEKGAPLFCIHPSGGDIGIYRKLAMRLDSSRSVWGIQSRLECGAETELDSLEEMAREYTEIIDQQHPIGAIRILGFSLGGFLASLIARNFHDAGRKVSFLGLIDSNPGWTAATDISRQELCNRLTQVFTKFQKVGIMQKKPIEVVQRDVGFLVNSFMGEKSISTDEVMAKTIAMGYVPERQLDASVLTRFTSTFVTHCALLKDFQPPQVHCPLSLWWPSETETENKAGTSIWLNQATHKVSASTIEGSHYSIMRGPAVRVLASELDSAIRQTDDCGF